MSIDTELEAPPVPDGDTTRIERQAVDHLDFSPAVELRLFLAEASKNGRISQQQTREAMGFIDSGENIVMGKNGSAGPCIDGCVILRRFLAEALQEEKISPQQGVKIMRFIDKTEDDLIVSANKPKFFNLEIGKQLCSAVGRRLQRLFRWGSAN